MPFDLDALLADHARAIHLRRQLEAAAEHGAAVLSALGLPRLVRPDFVLHDIVRVGDALDRAIATLDALDATPDLEDGADDELTGDDELSLGWRERVGQLDLGIGQDDGEPTLGAPERSPWVMSFSRDLYELPCGRPARCFGGRHWAQTSWAHGRALEGESKPGYDLREPRGRRQPQRRRRADARRAPAGDGNQRHWAQGASTSHEPEADPLDGMRLYKSPAKWEATYARRPALHALVARARALRAAPPYDPDMVTPIGPGMASWGGLMRHPLCNVTPVDARVMVDGLSNLRELGT